MRLFSGSEDGNQHHDDSKPEQRTAESDQHFGDAGDRPVHADRGIGHPAEPNANRATANASANA
jgi:hypothetical protein